MDASHRTSWGTEMHVVAGREVAEINCYPLGGVAKGQIVKNPEATLEFSPESRLELGLNCNLGRREKLFSHYPKPVLFESNKLGLNRKVGCAVVVGSDWLF